MAADDVAAAIRYDESLPAPFVIASGRGIHAQRLVEIATRCEIPVEQDGELAGQLVTLDPGTLIPEELFEPIAIILAVILHADDSAKNRR